MDLDPESGSAIRKNAGSVSGSALNQCGSETLVERQPFDVDTDPNPTVCFIANQNSDPGPTT